jgi:hypothetical protein
VRAVVLPVIAGDCAQITPSRYARADPAAEDLRADLALGHAEWPEPGQGGGDLAGQPARAETVSASPIVVTPASQEGTIWPVSATA